MVHLFPLNINYNNLAPALPELSLSIPNEQGEFILSVSEGLAYLLSFPPIILSSPGSYYLGMQQGITTKLLWGASPARFWYSTLNVA